MEGTNRWPAGTAVPVSGVATTIKCAPGDNLGLARELSLSHSGDVLVVDAQGFSQWYLDGFRLPRHARDPRGLAGLIVSSAHRDIGEAQDAGFLIHAAAVAPWAGSKAGPCEVNVPVRCGGGVQAGGGVVVVVSANREGRIVAPRRSLRNVADAIGRLARLDDGDDDALRALFDLADEIDFDCSRVEPP